MSKQPHPYTSTPSPRDRLSTVLCLTFAALTIGAFAVASTLPAYASLVQFVGFGFLVAMTYIMIRNRTPFTYTVEQEPDGENWDLVISRKKGKQYITACRLCMKDAVDIDICDRVNRSVLKERYKNDEVHNYCPTLFPEISAYLIFEDSDPYDAGRHTSRVVIYTAHDPNILQMLAYYIDQRRT
jgi:hypothetical protein